jgi:EAL domain-containing protein (putative c-di-GMP-specific phosphodiesterase class I)
VSEVVSADAPATPFGDPATARPSRPDSYGTCAAALLESAWTRLTPRVDELIDRFYARLDAESATHEVLARLTDVERERLKRSQAQHLRDVLDPEARPEEAARRSRKLGRVHAMVAVEMGWYISAISDHQRDLFEALTPWPDQAGWSSLHAIITQRFMDDLHGALLGYRDVDTAQHRVMMQVTEAVGGASTVADLARGLLEAIASLDGVTLALVARPDVDGRLHFELGAGTHVKEFMDRFAAGDAPAISTDADEAAGQGPGGRAWRSGRIARCDALLLEDERLPWRTWAERFGWRSMAAVPLNDPSGRPIALLAVYSRLPGYFAHESRAALLSHVKQVTEQSLVLLESRPTIASGMRGYVDRVRHVSKLRAGDVEMLFQPVVALPSGELLKVEALARLRDENRLVSPAEFLPSFGDEELLRLFEVGVDQSLSALRTWDEAGVHTGVSVNLPVMSAEDVRYLHAVEHALKEHGIEPERLTLELLESGKIGADLKTRRDSMDQFKALGVRLAQDDLGSGYSSLLRLRHFDFDDVKIDQQLIRGNELAPRANLQFVQPITTIAHGLGLQVIVEGLENDGLVEAVVQLGVDAGQGYGIAYPMPAGRLVEWARSYSLEIDPHRPRTALGALASHISWEHRLIAIGTDPAGDRFASREGCMLTRYLREGHDESAEVHDAHAAVHETAIVGRGSSTHREAWEQLVRLLGES